MQIKIILLIVLVANVIQAEQLNSKPPVKMMSAKQVTKLYADFNYQDHELKLDSFVKKMSDKKTVILDLRSEYEFKNGHAQGALNLGPDVTAEKLRELIPDNDVQVLTYCANSLTPTRMMSLTHSLLPQIYSLGIKNVFYLENVSGATVSAEKIKEKLSWTTKP